MPMTPRIGYTEMLRTEVPTISLGWLEFVCWGKPEHAEFTRILREQLRDEVRRVGAPCGLVVTKNDTLVEAIKP